MASQHHQYVHDSEDNTSDSNEEFASASEGDDDLPWEPVVIRSPIISRQSPVSSAQSSSQVETPRPAYATTTIQTSSTSSTSIATATAVTTTTTATRTLTATDSFGRQQQQQQFHEQHSLDQGSQEHHHYQQQAITAAPHPQAHRGQEQEWEQSHHQQQQWTSTTQVSSSSPRTLHAHREFSSSSSSSTRSQDSPSQVLRGAAPKLRERMRQSPVLHSRIVQAYLNPNASQGQRQQQQHETSENVRQAWLQDHRDTHQESSEDDTEEEIEQERHQTAPVRPTPAHAPTPVYQHPVVPLPAPVAAGPSFESLSPTDQHHTEHSWSEADTEAYEDHAQLDYHHYQNDNHQEEGTWGFNESIAIDSGVHHGEEQVEEAWDFDEPIGIESRSLPAEPAAEAAWDFDEDIEVEGQAQVGEQQTETAWGFDDDIQLEQHVQDHQSYTDSVQSISNNTHIQQAVQPTIHHDETAWGFDDNLHVEETVQPDLHQVEAAWGFDDNIDIEGGVHAEGHPEETAPVVDETLHIDQTARPDQHQEESAWGFDDDIQIDEPTQQKQHQDESAWGFDGTIDIVTSTHQEQPRQDTSEDIQVRASVDESTGSDHHVGASWGFEDKIEIGDTHQIEQIETSWGFDEQPTVEAVNEPEPEYGLSDNTAATAEATLPTMHQAHESDADAWDYDDQAIELVEEAAAQEVHSSSFAANEHDALVHQEYQQPHVNKTDDSFSEHVAMPPSSTASPAGEYDDEQELPEVADSSADQLVQGQHLHADEPTGSTSDHHNLHHITSGETFGIDSAGPSDTVEEVVAEQSWGFDMDEVIGSADVEYEQIVVQEPYQPEEPHIAPLTSDNNHDQVQQESLVSATIGETEATKNDEAVMEDESKNVDQASDDEHDSEVREVLFATQQAPVAVLDDVQNSEISPFATNSHAHSRSSGSFDDSAPYYADAAVTSHLLVKENATPQHRSDSRASIGELKRSISDSEGSDIYGDLSTAYTGRNMSSNRLDEILDDDDYLEHMERGVPMDRSIRTPFSDDETPKFVMEDDAVELMERGEPQSISGAPSDHSETLEDEQDNISDDNQATPSVPEPSTDAADKEALSDLAHTVDDETTPQCLPDSAADLTTDLLSHGDQTNIVEKETDTTSAEGTKAEVSESEATSTVFETVDDDVVSDECDPANPFSDAAAIDDSDLWPATNEQPLLEKSEKEEEELSSELSLRFETPSQVSVIDDAEGPTASVLVQQVTSPSRAEFKSSDYNLFGELPRSQGPAVPPASTEEFSEIEAIVRRDTESFAQSEGLTSASCFLPISSPKQPLSESRVDVQAVSEPGPFDNLKEEAAGLDDSEEIAVDTTEEASGAIPLQYVETSVTLADETPSSHLTDALATPLKETALEVDAWDNQADTLDLDAALEEDAWADEIDTVPAADIPAVPVAPAVVHQERSVSDLFADKSNQEDSQPASPTRAFAASLTRAFAASPTRAFAFTPARSTTTSPVRGFAAFSSTSREESSVSDLFGVKSESEQRDVKPASRVRGFGAFNTTSHVTKEQERSVSDLFSDTPDQQQQPVQHSTPVPAPALVQEDFLMDAVEDDDAWDNQDVHIDEEPMPVAITSEEKSEAEQEQEQAPEPVETAVDIEQSIDDALEGGAWGDDQDVQIIQEAEPVTAESEVITATITAAEAQEVIEHATLTLEQNSESHSPQEPTHAFNIDQSIDAAIEDDAWDTQDDVTFESTFPPKQEVEQELPQEPLHTLPATSSVENLVQEDDHKHEDPIVNALSIDHSLEAALEEDGWDNQEDVSFGQEFNDHQDRQFIEQPQPPVHSEDVVAEDNRPVLIEELELDHAIDAAMEEDMWADNDLPAFCESSIHSMVHAESPASPITETQVTKDSPASDRVEEPEDQLILPSLESPALPTPADAEDEFDVDKALEDDAWNDQGGNEDLYASESTPTDQNTHVESVQEFQDHGVNESEERPSLSGSRIGSILHVSHTKTAAEIVNDAWGWDDDEVGVNLEMQADITSPYENDSQGSHDDGEHKQALSAVDSEESVVAQEKSNPDALSPTQVTTETPDNNLSPLAIQKERLAAGADSGEGEADSATQSPWQDISPASVSKRSEAGMSIGSEFESEYSVRSLDEDGHISPAFDRQPTQERHASTLSAEPEPKKGLETTMSWTDLKEDDAWNDDDLPETGPVNIPTDSQEPSAPTKENKDSADVQPFPDISGADSWDFDQDDDLQSELASPFSELTPASTRAASFSRTVRTPDMTESRSFGSLSSPQKTPTFSSMTSSPGQVLSSYQSSILGSTPVSPSHAASLSSAVPPTTAAATEVEDDSHLPVAIRQQRARLAARGKPLPPISKYKSTKDATEQQTSPSLSSASLHLAAATTSPVISFASPARTPISPMLNPTPVAAAAAADHKYLSPALQKQRERLEKKRAASAAAAAAPLSAARRLGSSDSSPLLDHFSSSSTSSLHIAPIKPTSPLIKEATLHSAMKHTSMSPTTFRKSVQLVGRSDLAGVTTTTSPSAEEFGHSTRRRGLSVSSNQSLQSSTSSPSTPTTAEGFVSRRSKDGHRPSMFSSSSATTTPTSATFSEAGGESNVVKSTQNDAFRHISRLSMSSSTAGFGWDDTPEEDVQKEEEDAWSDKKSIVKSESKILSKGVDRKDPVESRPTLFSSTSSSSFYQQSVPGLDGDDYGESSKLSTTVTGGGGSSSFTGSNINTCTTTSTTTITTTSTTSSYLSSKKVDDYDPYGPIASRSKAKSSFDGDRDSSSYPEANEILIGRSTPSPGVSLLSPTSDTSMSHRHDHHHQSPSSRFGGVTKEVSSHNSSSQSSSGGFFGGGGGGSGSLVSDINSLLQEKKNPAPSPSSGFGAGANLGSDYEPKNPSGPSAAPTAGTPSAVQQKQQALSKSSSWSFGSWVSSAVAAATEKIDQAYESLDPEYSRMKTQSPSMSNSTTFTSSAGGAGGEGGSGDPNSLSPFKKPGYVVGGSSLALGLASISTGPAATSGSSSGGAGAGAGSVSPQVPHRYGWSSSEVAVPGGNKRDEDHVESFASAGNESDSYGHHGAHAHHRATQAHSHTSESLSPRLTRKNVSGR